MHRFMQFSAKIQSRLKQEHIAAAFASITARVALFIIITCSVPLLLVGWYFTDQMIHSLTQAAIQRNNQVADRIASDIDTFILAQKNSVVLTSGKEEMRTTQPVVPGSLHTMIEHVLSQNPGYAVTVMDKNRVPLYHQMDTTAVEARRTLDDSYFRVASEQESGFTEGIYRGQEYLVSFRPIANTDWLVLSCYPKEVALQSAREMVRHSIYVTLLIVAVFVVLGLVAARKALSPLKQLAAGAEYVAEGHLSYRLATDHKDEFGTVAKAFNHMADRLGGIVGSVQESSRLVKNAADQVAASSGELKVGSGQVVLALEGVTRQIEQQTRETQTTEHLLEEMVRISTAMSDSIKQVAAATDESVTVATQGQTVIDQAMGQMRTLQQLVAKTESMMTVLDQSAHAIGQISLTISQFSHQTNLLALNAAIEAARAGNAGRGFAVVAEEVRKLANESSGAVTQISEIVNKIQSETKEALTSMRQSCEYAGQGVAAAADSGQAFSRIAATVSHVQQEAGRIKIQTEKQVELCHTAMQAMMSSNQLAMQTSAHGQEITSISQEQAQIAIEMNHSIEKLRELSSRLDSLVTQFK
ncbi:methyl-accepting chemotaxis protein [Acetonema longum]|uniref:Methyl-accepting chemotaxis protein n=1 Tax=Acetonema longum DSM 6540 TaxID=1009370 RepID=F7NH73_9FIRM|nr:methyl-accepting chemotaxis protein [Acetonema longum]EGO64556.1 methyl-accepting chemotaxis protein [Acetonema longum DSM 6540]